MKISRYSWPLLHCLSSSNTRGSPRVRFRLSSWSRSLSRTTGSASQPLRQILRMRRESPDFGVDQGLIMFTFISRCREFKYCCSISNALAKSDRIANIVMIIEEATNPGRSCRKSYFEDKIKRRRGALVVSLLATKRTSGVMLQGQGDENAIQRGSVKARRSRSQGNRSDQE